MRRAGPQPQKSTTVQSLRPLVIPWPVRVGFGAVSALSPSAAARLAKHMFFAPPLALRRKAEPIAPLPAGDAFVIQSRGENVRGTMWGTGPTVLLVHGWAGLSGQMAGMVAPLTATGFRVVAADMPAHGESDGKLSSVVHFADALQALSHRFGPLQALVAHSFGAAAATYALSKGLEVERAVFFAPPARFDSFWHRFQNALGMSEVVRRRLWADSEGWLGVRFEDVMPIALAPKMKTPLLVIHDRGDREVDFQEGVELAAAWPRAILKSTEGLGHVRLLRDAGCIEAMREFVAGRSGAAQPAVREAAYSTATR